MEQYVIIFGIVATGCVTTFVQYATNQPKHKREKDLAKFEKIGNTLCKSLAASCVIYAFIALMFGLTGYFEKVDVINYVASFLVYALIFLVFSFSFSPPKIMSRLFTK